MRIRDSAFGIRSKTNKFNDEQISHSNISKIQISSVSSVCYAHNYIKICNRFSLFILFYFFHSIIISVCALKWWEYGFHDVDKSTIWNL